MKKRTHPILTHPGPCSKLSYSYAAAHLAINIARMPNLLSTKRKKKIPRRAYKCPTCQTWHLTSKKYDQNHDDN